MQLLIATDVAARGIDVTDLTHVLHHTLPDQLEGYTHRSGRTGRAGKKGISLAFINPREQRRINELERKINIKFERVEVPSVEELKSSRINNWANLIINTKVDDQSEGILHDLHGQFAHLTKEDLLKRLITTQLDHLMLQNGDKDNLNENYEESTRKHRNSGFHRYFVNIGSIDGVTKADLIHFLSDVSGIDRKHFGELTLQSNCAFFDVEIAHDKGLSAPFKGMEIEGRAIRVNRDDDGNKRRSRATSSMKRIRSRPNKVKQNFNKPRKRRR